MSIKTVDEIRDLIIAEFSPVWELNDKAHRIDHFKQVEACGLYINEKLCLGYDPMLIMLMAFYHDMFSWSRYNHHLMSGTWVETSKHPTLRHLSPLEITMVADACREHRASFTGNYSREFSELMASADRGFTGDVDSMVDRAIQYRLSRGYDQQAAHEGAILHIKEKYGNDGYARYPLLYKRAFGEEIEKQRAMIMAL